MYVEYTTPTIEIVPVIIATIKTLSRLDTYSKILGIKIIISQIPEITKENAAMLIRFLKKLQLKNC